MRSMLLAIAALAAGAGCQTQFIGDAHIDPATCQARCAEGHLEMAGMVYMGQYSSACLCEVPRAGAPAPGGPPGAMALASGALGATAGVIMQTRAADAQRSQAIQPGPPPNIRPPGPRM